MYDTWLQSNKQTKQFCLQFLSPLIRLLGPLLAQAQKVLTGWLSADDFALCSGVTVFPQLTQLGVSELRLVLEGGLMCPDPRLQCLLYYDSILMCRLYWFYSLSPDTLDESLQQPAAQTDMQNGDLGDAAREGKEKEAKKKRSQEDVRTVGPSRGREGGDRSQHRVQVSLRVLCFLDIFLKSSTFKSQFYWVLIGKNCQLLARECKPTL